MHRSSWVSMRNVLWGMGEIREERNIIIIILINSANALYVNTIKLDFILLLS